MESAIQISPAALVQKLAAAMHSVELESRKHWTTALKSALQQIYETDKGNGNEVLCTDRSNDRHEFLLDAAVWNRSDGEGLILAVESEWNLSVQAIEEDFWKLLVVKAPMKLMIFATHPSRRQFTQENVWQSLGKCLQQYRDHRTSERYVFIDFAPAPERRAWWIEISRDGKMESLPDRWFIELQAN